jgi:Fe2+ transport system protein FeoA
MAEKMSLSELKPGISVIVESISGGKHLRQRLVNLGVLPGSEVSVVRSNKMGPLVLNVKGSRIMIGQGMARQIYVKQK